MSERLHTVQQAARRLNLHAKTVLRLIHEGRLQGTRIGKSYRILDSDLRAFSGLSGRAQPGAQIRVTCVLEIEHLTATDAERIASFLGTAVAANAAGPDAIQLTTAYDFEQERLKAVVIAAPSEVVVVLQLLQTKIENLR